MAESEEKIEVVSPDEVRFQRSEFASVIFHSVADTYPADAHVECSYKLTEDIVPSSRDWVGIYKVGWMSPRDYIYYEWAPMPKNYEEKKEVESTILYQSHTLPNDDGEFYQFCYVSSAGQIRGASTPFQFKKPSACDFVEVEDDDTDMLIIRSRTMYLQENLKKKEDENRELSKYRETMVKEAAGLADKITDLQKKLEKSEQERKGLQKLLEANQKKLDEMLSDANDMTLVHDELRTRMDEKTKEKVTLEEKISHLQDTVGSFRVKLKVLQSEKDEMEGRNRTLEEEMELYKNHLSKSETSVSGYVAQIESLNSKLEQNSQNVTGLHKKIEEYEVNLMKCHEEINHLQVNLHQEKRRCEEQVKVTHSEKENMVTLTEKLRNSEDKLATEEHTKELMRQELSNFRDAQEKLSIDLAESKSECHMMKSQVCRMEEDFAQENALLKSENMANIKDLEKVLKEKELLQARMCSLQEELARTQESFEGTEGPMFALQQANTGLKERLTQLSERYTKLTEEKKQARLRERELNRETVDLKERIHMCSEEYKQIYKENRKLQKQIDRMLGTKKWRDSKSESETAAVEKVKVVKEKMQTSPERSSSESSTQASEPSRHMVTDVSELQTLLALEKSKKDKYKMLFHDEKERLETLRKHYHESLQAKDLEIEKLKQIVFVQNCSEEGEGGGRDQRIRSLEKYLEEKQSMIDELNLKLRDCKLEFETPKPAKRTNIPKSTECPKDYPLPEPTDRSTPKLIYGNPYAEQSKKLTLAEQAALMTSPVSVPGDVVSPPPAQQMNREEAEDVFVDASPHLPKPLEPEVTTEARIAAVKASILPSEDVPDGHCYGMPVNRTGIIPTAPAPDDGEADDIVVKVNSRKWLINTNGESRKCPNCADVFPAEMKEEDFMEHVLSHMGRICPVCKMQVDDAMENKEFEYHIHCCIGNANMDGSE